MLKSLLALTGLSVVLVACDLPEFYVYKNSIVNAENNEYRNIEASELFQEFFVDGLYGFNYGTERRENRGTMSLSDGNLKLRPYSDDDHSYFIENWQTNGAFIAYDHQAYTMNGQLYPTYRRRLFFELVVKPHWSMAPRYTLMEAIILSDYSIVMMPMKLDKAKMIRESNADFSRREFTPFPFADKIRLYEINNDAKYSHHMMRLMQDTPYRNFTIHPLTAQQKQKVEDFVKKYEIRTVNSLCVLKLANETGGIRTSI